MKTNYGIETALKLLFFLRIIRMALIFSVGRRGGGRIQCFDVEAGEE
jgi:hypothetical protein